MFFKHIEKYKELKRLVQREIRRAYWKYIEDIITPDPNDDKKPNCMKRFWTFIKHKRSDGNQIPPLRSNGLLHPDSIGKANILNKQFQSAFSEKENFTDMEFKNRCDMTNNSHPSLQDLNITENEITKLLSNLNPYKAAGPDTITSRVLKELSTDIAPILTTIFRRSYETGDLPDIWKRANVSPIFKKGKRFDAVNYRPVSLTCICCKIIEHIVTSHIMSHADKHNILYPLQHGFRRGLSCETQLINFINDITMNMDAGKQTDCLIMDFSKAFDKVSHSLLTHKLYHYGIRGKTNKWIQNFLSDRKQVVVVEGERSETIDVESGVPQGSVLGPSLFLFYINDMPEGIRSRVRLFADDTIVYLTIASDKDSDHLQEDLNKLEIWEKKWKMAFHPDKCNVLTITRKRKPIVKEYVLHGHTLESLKSAKYLGCTISSDLKWNEHIKNICTKANKTIGFLKRNLNINNTTIKETAYKSLVRPTLEYASTVWDPYQQNNKNRLEMVQRRAARYVTNRYHNTSSVSDMLNQLEWKTLEDRRRISRLAMMYKLANGMVRVDTENILIPPDRLSRNINVNGFKTPSCRTEVRKESFYPRTIKEWNSLPHTTTSAGSLDSFKTHLHEKN